MSKNVITINAAKRLIAERGASIVRADGLVYLYLDTVGEIPLPAYVRVTLEYNLDLHANAQFTPEFLAARTRISRPTQKEIGDLVLIAKSPTGYRDSYTINYRAYGDGWIDITKAPDSPMWRVTVSEAGKALVLARTGKSVTQHNGEWQAKLHNERMEKNDRSVFATWRGGLLVFTCNNLSGFYAEYSPASARVTVHGSVMAQDAHTVGLFMVTVSAMLDWRMGNMTQAVQGYPPFLLGSTEPRTDL